MKFDKETIIGLVLCLLLMLAWPSISQALGWGPAETGEPVAEKTIPQSTDTVKAAPAATAAAAVEKTAVPAAAKKKTADGILRNDLLDLTVDAGQGTIKNIRFVNYKHNTEDRSIVIADTGLFGLEIPGSTLIEAADPAGKENIIALSRTLLLNNSKLRVDQIFTLEKDYIIKCRYTLTNLSGQPVPVDNMVIRGAEIAPWHTVSGDKMRTMSHRLDIMTAGGDIEDIDGDEDDEDYYAWQQSSVQWASVSNKYFCSVLKRADGQNFPLILAKPRKTVTDDKGKEFNLLSAGAALPAAVLPANGSESFEFVTYTGPKKGDVLADFAPDGDKVMHLAWGPLNYLARFLMWILNMLHTLCGSYGVSIIILTLLVRSAFYPLTTKGNESMRKMQKVQPMFKELKEKYKDDPQLLNQKMAELYRKEGINPLAGCLPILLQIPIFFALYAMLDNAIALRHVSFLWCKNLAAADTVFSIPLGFTLPFFNIDSLPVNPLVLLMTVLMVIQQRMTPMAADPAQKKMMAMMPVIMLIFLYDLPSGLTLYWTISNLFSIIQLWLQKRRNQALQGAAGQSK